MNVTRTARDEPLVRLDLAGTALLLVTAAIGVAGPEGAAVPLAALSGVLFLAGSAALLWGLAIAAGRSRSETITLPGLFFLSGSAPAPVARWFRVLLAAQVAIALSASALRPFTAVAFSVLAPLFGLGVMTLWAARHGAFPGR